VRLRARCACGARAQRRPHGSRAALSPAPARLCDVFKPLNLPERTLLFFPLNDAPDALTPNAGTHWSLLVFSRRSERFYHYDSMPGSANARVAAHVAAVVWRVLLKLTFRDMSTAAPPLETPAFPAQRNSSDCGVYVCFLINALCLAGGPVDFSAVCTPAAVGAFRGHMNVTLQRMREEYEQLRGRSVVGGEC
jgi:hypothetical protein